MPTVSSSTGKVTDDFLRLIVWVVCDGTMVDDRKYLPNSNKRRIQFKLSRPEKIEGLQTILRRMGMPYTIKEATMGGVNKLQPYYIRIYGDAGRMIFESLEGIKQFPGWFFLLDTRQLGIVIATIAETDGSKRWHKVHWTTTSRSDLETIGKLCLIHGVPFKFREKEGGSGFKLDCKTQYRATMDAVPIAA